VGNVLFTATLPWLRSEYSRTLSDLFPSAGSIVMGISGTSFAGTQFPTQSAADADGLRGILVQVTLNPAASLE